MRGANAPSLFDAPPQPQVFGVAEITKRIKSLLEGSFDDLWVEGELSNVKIHNSGHCYFSLKDESAQLQGVMWRNAVAGLAFHPRDGLLVRVHGRIAVYEPRGQYQIVADQFRLAGVGALQKAFEELKARLDAEGLFSAERKRTLPRIPRAIGIVTSRDGAALRDMLSVLARRYPLVDVFLLPVRVQGAGASVEVAEAVETLNRWSGSKIPALDLVIVGRGGGSLEDLWAFNEEVIARALYNSAIPVISAVGHETDFTIADLVADVRAATPSMAAEIAVPDQVELRTHLRRLAARAQERINTLLRNRRLRLRALTQSHAFRRPVGRLEQTVQRLDDLSERLDASMRRLLDKRNAHIQQLSRRILVLDPRGPLQRGYIRVERSHVAITRASGLVQGDRVQLRFLDGDRAAEVLDNP